MSDVMLIAMRVVNMHRTHPRANYSHTCARCRAPVGIYPSGQKALRDNPGIEIVCEVCALSDAKGFILAERLPGVEQERRESVDFTKRKV